MYLSLFLRWKETLSAYCMDAHIKIFGKTDLHQPRKGANYFQRNFNLVLRDLIFMNGKKFKIIEINDDTITISNKINSSKKGKYKWGLVKDDMPYTTLFKYLVGTNDQKKLCLDYCFMDCMLLNMLICTGDLSFVEKTIFADGLNGFGYEKGYKKLWHKYQM